MNTTRSSILVAEVPGYTELQQEMHDALLAQHPEWIEADGKSPMCDYYESLFARLLVSHRAHDGAQPRSDIQRSCVPASHGQETVRYVHAPFSLSKEGAAFSS